ncbi:pentatricopeptide repeat-containing protein At2g17140-like [Sesamum indicum]|uniref:Pentatricopeptide repeat-containing protein At2g17140-like n=1 Tax=Sesamum indicum TaxID=4182 RepID=A0A8M8UTS6_SESIN|nr:pentatricopeptide repeat-containing protein At2g17140-like [Sesamum indicum]XP_020547364.1 pentatricopeptide repeat-containing protein At2g17140-like [Sesamum indicum]XP_020547366.1 pentatricopeptide repeat-containing protein At2g17140-like [Sesamum indicum]XP_020547368.1 pentatricopeptide repeat-containing protein At2g17140-like [Sesamum indicum]XP_020547369.1 pentatricopeptide repeat-containing protein At2g17140-like [Sesamum indicum]
MRILNNYCRTQNFLRYCLNCTVLSLFSLKTLNPKTLDTVLPSNSPCTISPLFNSSSGSSSFFSSESYSLPKRPFLSNSSSGSSSVLYSRLYSLQKEQPLVSLYLPTKHDFLINCSRWSCSRRKIGSYSRYKKQSLRYASSRGPSLTCSSTHSFLQSFGLSTLFKHNSHYVFPNSGCIQCGTHRCFTVASFNGTFVSGPVAESEVQKIANICSDQQKLEKRNNFPRKFVVEIIHNLRNNEKDLDSRLNMLSSRLSVYSITEIFEVLNSQRISGLRLFEWIWSNNPQLHKNAYICSLLIDNVGRLDDYETMFAWLKKFTSENICLTYEAFGFIPVLVSTDSSLKQSTKKVVDLLNKVGGSCRNSGVSALVEMFCKLDLFEMARYVIKITESKESYYCLLVREKCRRGLIEDAYSVIREMGEAHCAPNTKVYNYLLSSLWKNGRMDEASGLLDEMKEIGISPDAITFEILINFACSSGNMAHVHQLLDQMASQGLEPRLATHACIVKTLFAAEQYEAAHKHVDSSISYKTSSNMMYSLMAKLYWEKGHIVSAQNTLVEMMEKSLKPSFSIYIKIVKQLRRTGRANLARDLENRHSKFLIKSHA